MCKLICNQKIADGSGADEPQTPDVRFSLFEANFCAISLYWHLLGRAEPFSARFIAEFFPQKSAKQDQDISSILLECIRNANKCYFFNLIHKINKFTKIYCSDVIGRQKSKVTQNSSTTA